MGHADVCGRSAGDPVLGHVLGAVRRGGLLATERVIIVLLSGGRDSVCLLDVACTLSAPGQVRGLHVNYGLRPGADADQRHCAEACERLGVELEVVTASPGQRRGNLQAWARDVRYGAALARAEAVEGLVAAGHTASDQAETVLYRLASSPGRRALLGMSARQGRLVRPLLGLTREDTAAYCRARGLSWREDASNATDVYARGRVRHRLLPALRAIHPAAEANVRATAELLRDEAEVLDGAVDGVLDSGDTVSVARLGQLPPALGRLVLARLAEAAAGGLVPGVGSRLQAVLVLGARGGTAALDLGARVRAVVEYGQLRVTAQARGPVPAGAGATAPDPAIPAATVLAVPGEARYGDWRLRSRCVPVPARDALCAVGSDAAVLDADTLGGELTVRSWRRGDRLRPLGLGGSKALSDVFGERRLPRERRATIPILESGGEIAWVPGLAISERFRVTPSTDRAVQLTATSGPGPVSARGAGPTPARA